MIFIDQQPQMTFGVQSMDRQASKNTVEDDQNIRDALAAHAKQGRNSRHGLWTKVCNLRLVQVGSIPVTWQQVLLEWQCD